MQKWRAKGENSQISWVLFRSSTVSGGLRGGRRAVHVPHAHARLQWVGCTLHLPHCMFLQGTGVAWEKSSGDDVGQLSLSRWCVQVALSILTLSSTSGGPLTLQVQVPTKNSHFGKQMQNSGAAGTIKKPPRIMAALWPAQTVNQLGIQDMWFSQQNKFDGFDSNHPFSTATSVQLLFDCHSLPHRRQLVENAAWRHQLRDSGCQTHMMTNRAWSCGLLLWLETGLN